MCIGEAVWSKLICLKFLKSVVVLWLLMEPSFNIRYDSVKFLVPTKAIPEIGLSCEGSAGKLMSCSSLLAGK